MFVIGRQRNACYLFLFLFFKSIYNYGDLIDLNQTKQQKKHCYALKGVQSGAGAYFDYVHAWVVYAEEIGAAAAHTYASACVLGLFHFIHT